MVKSVLGVNHQGLRDWMAQRVSAIYMAIYIVSLVLFLMIHPELNYDTWHTLFSALSIKIATLVFIVLLLIHTWVGMWTIFTDYVTCFVARCFLNTLVLLSLLGCFFAALLILWGV